MLRLGTRRKARELTLKALYMLDIQDKPDADTIRHFWEGQPAKRIVKDYAEELFEGVFKHLEELDSRIGTASEHWRIERMSRVDRNVLRLAAYEILFVPEIPPQVSIDEAVEIARRYGDGRSAAFVNGILDRIWKEDIPDAP